MSKKVTVLMPVYNAENFLNQSIQSILNQSYSNFTFLIINDGSTDKSNEVIDKYLSDSRIELISLQENKGLIYCLNLGIEIIDSDYIVRMDADDISHKDRIKMLVDIMDNFPNVGICGTRVGDLIQEIPREIPVIEDSEIKAIHLLNCSITHASAIYRKSLIDQLSLKYRSDYIHSEDNDFISEILLNSKSKILDLNLYYVRKHDNQVSKKFREIQKINSSKKRAEILKNYFNISLNEGEFKIYKALSYREGNLNLDDFRYLNSAINKLFSLNNSVFIFDYNIFIFDLIRRVQILLLLNYKLGFSLLHYYLSLNLIGVNLKFSFRLFFKILLK